MGEIDSWIGKIHCGDATEVLKRVPAESIDCIATDPPYGYSFMGKEWDKAVPSVEIWKQCCRVLKDGSFMFVMSSPRQDVLSQMIVRLGQAGFETGFTSIYWAYASGFPKAMNVSKAVDKKLGAKREVLGISPNWRESKRDREKFGSMEVRGKNAGLILGEPVTEEAKALDGSYGGFQPKPAVEIIIVCMKPLSEKTYVEQALKNGKGVTWLDDCRIPIVDKKDLDEYEFNRRGYHERANPNSEHPYEGGWKPRTVEVTQSEGRFPANLLVSDDMLNDGKISKSKAGVRSNKNTPSILKKGFEGVPKDIYSGCDDSGSFSRYFDLDKWFEKTIEKLPEDVKKTFPFLICPKASKSERNKGCENLKPEFTTDQNKWSENDYRKGKGEKTTKPKGNFHPTVKPLKLMSYLVTLGSREGDVVLDPFVGSGTTCIAAKLLARKWFGIEWNFEYCQIASARLENCEIVQYDKHDKQVVAPPKVKLEATVQHDMCTYSGNCPYKNNDGNCTYTHDCKEKRK
jgi:site-specific DNA-methyltransferase (adenine-specific)